MLRLLPYRVGSGPWNMAADDYLMQQTANGMASLRMYGWTEATLSLGYFQSQASRSYHSQMVSLPYVRRPTGGMTLVHHHEITYGLALPATVLGNGPVAQWLEKVHQTIAKVLREFGVDTEMAVSDGPDNPDPLCYKHITKGDLTLANHKVVGSAQRRHRGGILQHGAILLRQSLWSPSLPGIAELSNTQLQAEPIANRFPSALAKDLGFAIQEIDWHEQALSDIEALVCEKYSQSTWNDKR